MKPDELVRAFHAQVYPMGVATAERIIIYAQKVLLPDPELIAVRCELLRHDLELLEQVEHHIDTLEEQLRELLQQTPYQILDRLKGLGNIQVASLAAAVGKPEHYTSGSQIFRRSGLCEWSQRFGNPPAQGERQRRPQNRRCLLATYPDQHGAHPGTASTCSRLLLSETQTIQARRRCPSSHRSQSDGHPVGDCT